MVTNPPITDVCFASYNTRRMSELCVRSMRKFAGYPFRLSVGDCGSTDGSLAMFQGYATAGQLHLEVAPLGRRHGEWLDHWFRTSEADLLVFCDSDVEYLAPNWLADMVQRAEDTGAALIATRIQALDGVPYVHPGTGAIATLAARPEPWLMMLDLRQLRGKVTTSFLYTEEIDADGTKVAFDTAAAFFRDTVAAGLSYGEMPTGFSRSFRHYSGLTWQRRGIPISRQLKQAAKRCWVNVRWTRSRLQRCI